MCIRDSFINHLINLGDPEDYDTVVAVIGAPAEASFTDQTAIFDAASGSVNAAMIISEPFAVAYALDMIGHTIVIDIGAGTCDIARVYGTIPGPDDQMHTSYAGDHIDNTLIEEVQKKYAVHRLQRTWRAAGSSSIPSFAQQCLMRR